MPTADKGKYPLGEADAKSIPGSRLSRKKWAGAKTNTSKKVRKSSKPAKTYGRTHGVVGVTAIRYHRDQNPTAKEHVAYTEYISPEPVATGAMQKYPKHYTGKGGVPCAELVEKPTLCYAKADANIERIGGTNLSDNLVEGKSYLKKDRHLKKGKLVTQGPAKATRPAPKVDRRKLKRQLRKAERSLPDNIVKSGNTTTRSAA